jgi:hypothetical protein
MAYVGFKKLAKKLGGDKKGAAIAASIGRKKYGKKKMQTAAAKGKSLKNDPKNKK